MIGVVGGGLAGLTAAYRLRQRGREVRVFEARDRLGGLAAPVGGDRPAVERYPQRIAPGDVALLELAAELGVDDRLTEHRLRTGYYVDGAVYPVSRLSEALAFPRLSLRDKLHLSALVRGRTVGPFGPPPDADDPATYDDVTARSFVTEHATRSAYEQAIAPLLRARFGDRADRVSAAWLLGYLARRRSARSRRGDRMYYPEGGLATIVDALADAVGRERIATGARVTPFGTAGGTVDHLVVIEDGERVEYDVDGVVVAGPPALVERLSGEEWAGSERGVVSVLFGLAEPLLDADRLTVVDDAPFRTLVEHTNLVAPDRYGGDHLLYAVAPAAPADPQLRADDALVDRWTDGLADLFPSFDPDAVRWSTVSRDRRAGPLPETGSRDRVLPYDLAERVADGCFYAGNASPAQYPIGGLDGAVRAGFECAARVDDALERAETAGQRVR